MLLDETDHYTLHRWSRFLAATFKRPHRVLSTCRVNGGLREDLTHIANHQSCEGIGHAAHCHSAMRSTPDAAHAAACAEAGLPPAATALMSTAANMQCAVVTREIYADLTVQIVATAGVLGNATRAGDPAGWHEQPGGSVRVERPAADVPPSEAGAGTIVTLAFINQPCTPACLVKAATMVTEAKSAALLDLRMPSLQSPELATGTGTDQLAIAAPLENVESWARHWAGSHNTLGELLGRATHEAVTRCLLLQNGLCPELRRTVCSALGRYGCDEAALCACAEMELEQDQAHLFTANLLALIHDPQSAAVAYCLAESMDLARVGILHPEVAREAILNQAALLAATVAVQPQRFAEFRTALAARPEVEPAALAALAMVQGFAHKWS